MGLVRDDDPFNDETTKQHMVLVEIVLQLARIADSLELDTIRLGRIAEALEAQVQFTLRPPGSQLPEPTAFDRAGEEIYRDKFQEECELKHKGKFVAINVNLGTATVGKTMTEAIEGARLEDKTGVFHLIRIGFPTAFRM